MTGIYESMWRNGLVRPLDGRVLGGVCAGLARRFGIDPWPMRWLFIIILVVLPGSPLLIYPLLWIFMPGEDWAARSHGPGVGYAGYAGGAPHDGGAAYGGAPYAGGATYGSDATSGGSSVPGASVDDASGDRSPEDRAR